MQTLRSCIERPRSGCAPPAMNRGESSSQPRRTPLGLPQARQAPSPIEQRKRLQPISGSTYTDDK